MARHMPASTTTTSADYAARTAKATGRRGSRSGAARLAAGIAAVAGLGAASFAGAGVARAQTDTADALGSVTAGSVGLSGSLGVGSATGSLPGQCSAISPLLGSAGIGLWNQTTAVPGDEPGHTAFLVDQNLPSEGSSTTEDPVIRWKNEDTGATGALVQGPGEGKIYWFEHAGQDVWGADVETGAGRITWTMTAHESGIFPPALSAQVLVPGLVPPVEFPYIGCGGEVVVP